MGLLVERRILSTSPTNFSLFLEEETAPDLGVLGLIFADLLGEEMRVEGRPKAGLLCGFHGAPLVVHVFNGARDGEVR